MTVPGGDTATPRSPRRSLIIDGLRVIVVAGIVAGAVLVGLGSRLAMLLLRLTSPDRAQGVVSDDGFTIGRVTLAGTYNLLLIGAVVGMVGAAVYLAVAPRLIGPTWFRRATTGMAAGAVGGALLVHADGVDFTLLRPTWFAIALFVTLPAVFGTFVGSVVDAVGRTDSWTRRRPWQWLLPIIAVACFPPTVVVIAFAAPVLAVWVLLSQVPVVARLRQAGGYVVAVRALWLAIAILGAAALVRDTQAVVAAVGDG
jgi:hypothetical protein